MARSIRVIYQNVHGRIPMNFNWGGVITKDSAVVITAAEWTPAGGIFGLTVGRPNTGAADVHVTNVGPHGDEGGGGGVEFVLHVDWGQPLTVAVTITVLEPVDQTMAA